MSAPAMLKNAARGEAALLAGGRPYRLLLTLGALAEIEDGLGLADLSAVLDPTCMVIGGGVAEAGDLLLEPARAAHAESLNGRGFRPLARIELARFGPLAGLVGAADLARRRV